MKKILFFVALIGWTLAVLVHILSILNMDVAAKAPYVWVLHLGLFIVLIPAILLLRKNRGLRLLEREPVQRSFSPFAQLKPLFKNTPSWMTVIMVAGLCYAFINSMLFMSVQRYSAAIENGQYILHNHGQFVRTLTEKEYNHYRAGTIRGFSGHWIAFYGVAVAMLYPFSKSGI